ncbi:MAG TPA: GNAT family N-acetyltransferase [Pseudonocardiaceae bacterium]|nr:GNAT family N-acetyltransferase [Pseudonocardiaceae bacterium]
MTVAEQLRQAQATRLAALDPLLPPQWPAPAGEVLTAALPTGRRVAGVLTRTDNALGTLASLWSAQLVWELHPLVGADPRLGMDALLRAWRARLDRVGPNAAAAGGAAGPADSAGVVAWPSRDAEAARALLDHGFVPLSVLAVRTAENEDDTIAGAEGAAARPAEAGAVVRRARPGDLDAAVRLAMAELSYSALVGGTIIRPDAAELKREAIGYRLHRDDPVWLAERDGLPAGLAECWLIDVPPEAGPGFLVPAGRWGYVNTVAVTPAVRGEGVGRAMLAVAHRAFRRAGVRGSYLYYNPANPLSSVFWPRQGYRPLWTIWEVRPVTAIR